MTRRIRFFASVVIIGITVSSSVPTAQSGSPATAVAATDDADFAAFVKKATTKPADLPPPPAAVPGVREMVSLRLDREVLDHFQADGPGWQDRINDALRKLVQK